MPFVAKNLITGERVDITKIQNPRQVLNAGEHVCQLCEAPMVIVAGQIVAHHFRHHKNICNSDYQAHPESREHREAKLLIQNYLNDEIAEYSDVRYELEVRIPEVKRVADVMAIFPMGWRVAHEIQLASITTEELEHRTNDYLEAGIDVCWWLGNKADTPANRNWCLQTFGLFRTITFSSYVVSDYTTKDKHKSSAPDWDLQLSNVLSRSSD